MLTSPVFRVAARSQKYRKLTQIAALASVASSNRTFTQPSTATRASVVDIPQTRLKNAELVQGIPLAIFTREFDLFIGTTDLPASTLHAQRHVTPISSLNPIYLDAQVSLYDVSTGMDS